MKQKNSLLYHSMKQIQELRRGNKVSLPRTNGTTGIFTILEEGPTYLVLEDEKKEKHHLVWKFQGKTKCHNPQLMQEK